jgi:hypothetical protein
MVESNVVVGVEKKGGGRKKKRWGVMYYTGSSALVHYMNGWTAIVGITASLGHEPMVMLSPPVPTANPPTNFKTRGDSLSPRI